MKTAKTHGRVEANQNDKILRRNSAGRTSSKLEVTRNGRIIKGSRISRERITRLKEERIPELAKDATTQAYQRALSSGSKVLIAEAGQIKVVFPDGKMRIVRQIEPSVKMQKGKIIKIR